MNIRLKKLPRVCKQLDEQYVSANHVSIDLLERRFLEKQAEGGLLADPAAPIRKGRLP